MDTNTLREVSWMHDTATVYPFAILHTMNNNKQRNLIIVYNYTNLLAYIIVSD